jgi:ribose transport system permease protein
MNVAQDKGVTSQYGQGAELVVIAAVIVGGAAIAGGRGRVIGACLGALMIVLIDKVLREGIPITRIQDIAGIRMEVQAMAQLPPGAVPAFLGLILLVAVLLEPWIVRRQGPARLWAKLRGKVPPLPLDGGIAITGVQTRGASIDARGMGATGLRAFLARRDAAAILLAVALWLCGMWLRPDFWGSLDNSFTLLLAFTEVALLAIGLTFVIANGDIDLSVGSVLALSGATAAFLMKELAVDPSTAIAVAIGMGVLAGAVNGWLTVQFGLPSFVATLGMFYIARGLGAWMVSGRQLSGFPESFNLIGRNLFEVLAALGMAPAGGFLAAFSRAVSVQTLFVGLLAVGAAWVLSRSTFGQKVFAVGGNERAAAYAGINTKQVRFMSLVFCSLCAAIAGVIYVAYFRSFNPAAGLLRELDAIAAVIIGGGSIFGGYGSIIGSMAGAAVITLIRSLLSLQIILADGSSFVMPQHWMNVFIGIILIGAVVGDIWLRQQNILGRLFGERKAPAKLADA